MHNLRGSFSAALVAAPQSALEDAQSAIGRKLRVLLDARKLGDGGIGVYIENLIGGLAAEREVSLTVIVKQESDRFAHIPPSVERIYDEARSYSFDEMFRLSRRIDFSAYDVFHEPHYTLPYGVPIPSVVTVHDLIHLRYPEKPFVAVFARFLISSALRRADRVLTVSQASCRQLSDLVRSREAIVSKLRVVPNALDPFFLEQEDEHAAAPHQRACGRYLLSILSNLKPHKGVADLLQAFRLVKEGLENRAGERSGKSTGSAADLRLVLLGAGTQSIVDREQLLELASKVKGVKIVGRVSKEDLRAWYRGALALVIPSKEEGFCLPVIEAQAAGTPVIARPVPAVRDILSESDLICRDFSVEELAAKILEFVVSEDKLRAGGHPPNLAHLEHFSRDKIARSIVSVYREAAGLN